MWGRNSNAFLDALINSNDGVVLTPDFKTCELNGPLSVEMIARCVSWIEQGIGPTDAQAADIGGGAQLFTTGRLGMDITGSWQIDAYLKSTDLNFDLMMVPIRAKEESHLWWTGQLGHFLRLAPLRGRLGSRQVRYRRRAFLQELPARPNREQHRCLDERGVP